MEAYKLVIDGQLIPGARQRPVINPATAQQFAFAPVASAEQLEGAIQSAKRAFPQWAALSVKERQRYVAAVADALEAELERMAQLLTLEQGKPLFQARLEVDASVRALRYCSVQNISIRQLPSPNSDVEVHRKPLGVVACITPWNYPLLLAINKVAPGLVTGNTLVLKPAPTTPLTTLEFGRLCQSILPPGVINVIADDNDLGTALTGHPDVAKVSFTGSTQTGKNIAKNAAGTVKRLTLELGGNDAAIVLGDADINVAVQGLVTTAFYNCGQVCVAPKRIYVHESIYEEFSSEFVEAASKLVMGPGQEEGVQLGPLQNESQFQKVQAVIRDAAERGKIMTGGRAADRDGYFIEPTVVCDIKEGTLLVDQEQFGPVVPLIRYHDEEDALVRANASPYGLGGSIWSKDQDRAKALAMRLETGMVWVNQHLNLGPDIPFAGAKQSGIGVESGEESLLEFTQLQVVNVARPPASS
jgi:acyl-CoA reductase-like NAD-dependent aldehyde dehydrogenase